MTKSREKSVLPQTHQIRGWIGLWQNRPSLTGQSSPDRRRMKEEIREITAEELLDFIKVQPGDFLIRVEPKKEEAHGNERPLLA